MKDEISNHTNTATRSTFSSTTVSTIIFIPFLAFLLLYQKCQTFPIPSSLLLLLHHSTSLSGYGCPMLIFISMQVTFAFPPTHIHCQVKIQLPNFLFLYSFYKHPITLLYPVSVTFLCCIFLI